MNHFNNLGGSARRKASTYTGQHEIEKRDVVLT
jgi:hypothetical protein